MQEAPLKALIETPYANYQLLHIQPTCLRTTITFLYPYQALKSNKPYIFPHPAKNPWCPTSFNLLRKPLYSCPSILLQPPSQHVPWRNLAAFSTAARAGPAVTQMTTSTQMTTLMAEPETSIWMQAVHLGGEPRKQSEGGKEARLIKTTYTIKAGYHCGKRASFPLGIHKGPYILDPKLSFLRTEAEVLSIDYYLP